MLQKAILDMKKYIQTQEKYKVLLIQIPLHYQIVEAQDYLE